MMKLPRVTIAVILSMRIAAAADPPKTALTVQVDGLQFQAAGWKLGGSAPATGTPGSKAVLSSVTLTKALDSASVPLLQKMFSGSLVPVVTITESEVATGRVLVAVRLGTVRIEKIQSGGTPAATTETITMNYQRISMASTGGPACWDVVRMVPACP